MDSAPLAVIILLAAAQLVTLIMLRHEYRQHRAAVKLAAKAIVEAQLSNDGWDEAMRGWNAADDRCQRILIRANECMDGWQGAIQEIDRLHHVANEEHMRAERINERYQQLIISRLRDGVKFIRMYSS